MIVMAVAALLLSAAGIDAGEEPIIRVDTLVQEAMERSPKIFAARERHTALKEKISQAGALEDPMLGFGVVNLPNNFDFNEEDMTMKEISVSQKFPFPGKRGLNEEIAAKEAEAGAAEVDDIVNQVVRDVKTIFYDLSHVYRAIEVTQRNKSLLEELAKITRTRYSLGQVIQEDVIRSQVEISKMVDDLIMLEQKKRALAAKLNYLLNRPPKSPVGQPAEFDFSRVAFSIEELQQQAIADNPMLKALKQEIAARGKNIELAKRDYLPDFSLKFAYGQREDRLDMYTGMIEMNLPIFIKSKQERKVAEGYADVRSAQAKYDGAQNEILYMVADMGSMVQRLERKNELYRTGILPQAQLQVDTAMSAYMVNKADFMTLLDSRMKLYRYELDYHDALTEYEKSLAALEALVGKTFSREVVK
ncbi:MAG: TolC family protein [Deltaproteobacteria bacterium]|nr:TolC family protein [Deltaproteobacteria bacterium]